MVTRSDFENLFAVWPEYLSGKKSREELRDLSQNSTYIITLLNWAESRSAG
jgi:hypothetical protein